MTLNGLKEVDGVIEAERISEEGQNVSDNPFKCEIISSQHFTRPPKSFLNSIHEGFKIEIHLSNLSSYSGHHFSSVSRPSVRQNVFI